MIRVATLFSGVGTPEQSLKHLKVEHETVFACEIDKYARTTYLANNETPNTFYDDVYNIDGNKYKNQIDILIGGSPCQSFSIAGKRMGTSCPRGNLIYEYFRIVEESQPKVFIYENVKGFLSIDKGETFKNFVQSFKDLGYTTYHQVLNTKDYLVPQNRERIYIVGFKDNIDFHFQEKQELKLRLKDMLEDEVDKKYLLNQTNINFMNTIWGKDTRWRKMKNPIDGCAGTICATHSKGLPRGVIINDKDIQEKIYKEGTIKLEQVATINIKGNDSIKRIYSSDGLCPSLTTMQGGHREPKVAIANGVIEIENDEVRVREAVAKGFTLATEGDSINISVPSSKTRRGRVGKQVAQTLDTSCNQVVFFELENKDKKLIHNPLKGISGKGWHFEQNVYSENSFCTRALKASQGSGNIQKVITDKYIFRKLTPRECFRLQGFDDNFIFAPKMSDSQLYKQAGNGMSRNILDMIFTQIFTCYSKHIENKEN